MKAFFTLQPVFFSILVLSFCGFKSSYADTFDYQSLAKCCDSRFVDVVVSNRAWIELDKARGTRKDLAFWNTVFKDPRIPSDEAIYLITKDPTFDRDWRQQALKTFLTVRPAETIFNNADGKPSFYMAKILADTLNAQTQDSLLISDAEMHVIRNSLFNNPKFHVALFEAMTSYKPLYARTDRESATQQVSFGIDAYAVWRNYFDKNYDFMNRHVTALGLRWNEFLELVVQQGGAGILAQKGAASFPEVGLLAADRLQARIDVVAINLASTSNQTLSADIERVLERPQDYYLSANDIPQLVKELLKKGFWSRVDRLPKIVTQSLGAYAQTEPDSFFKTIWATQGWNVLREVLNSEKINLSTLVRLRELAVDETSVSFSDFKRLNDAVMESLRVSGGSDSIAKKLNPDQMKRVAEKLFSSLRISDPAVRIQEIQRIKNRPEDSGISVDELPRIYQTALNDGKLEGLALEHDYFFFAPIFPRAFLDWAVRTESWEALRSGLNSIFISHARGEDIGDFCKTLAENPNIPFRVFYAVRQMQACKSTDFNVASWAYDGSEIRKRSLIDESVGGLSAEAVFETLVHWVPAQHVDKLGNLPTRTLEAALKRWEMVKSGSPEQIIKYVRMLGQLVFALESSPFALFLKNSDLQKTFHEAVRERLALGIPFGWGDRLNDLKRASQILGQEIDMKQLLMDVGISQTRTNEFRLVNSIGREFGNYGIDRTTACDIIGTCFEKAGIPPPTDSEVNKDFMKE